MELLRLLGFRNLDILEAHGITGADLLELDEHDLRDELKVPHLQVCTSGEAASHVCICAAHVVG